MRNTFSVLAAILALVLVGCGGTSTNDAAFKAAAAAEEQGRTQQQKELKVEEAKEAAKRKAQQRREAAAQRRQELREQHEEEAAANQPVTVPDETSERLDLAEEELENDHLSYKVVGGGLFGVVVKSHWVVCKTRPSAGTTVSPNTPIKHRHWLL